MFIKNFLNSIKRICLISVNIQKIQSFLIKLIKKVIGKRGPPCGWRDGVISALKWREGMIWKPTIIVKMEYLRRDLEIL